MGAMGKAVDAKSLHQSISVPFPNSAPGTQRSIPSLRIECGELLPLLKVLRDDPQYRFDLLLTHTAVDWPEAGQFELVYILFSTHTGMHLQVSAFIPRNNPVAPSVAELWRIAHWQEREVYDLFGVLYDGHDDLRRLFLEDDWNGSPLRKDYADPYMLERPVWP